MILSDDASSRVPLPREPVLRRSTVATGAAPPVRAERRAPSEAISSARPARARTVRRDRLPRVERMAVRPHSRGWQLTIAGVDQPAWVVRTKAKAVKAAREAASFHRCPLDVHGRNGARQKTIPPAQQA